MSSLLLASLFASSRSKKKRQHRRRKKAEINDSIAKFIELKNEGIITELEFELIKSEYLNKYQKYFDRSLFGI